MSLAGLVVEIDRRRPAEANLSSAIRLFVLDWFRSKEPA
jgi:predicted DNA-binding ribbon-helix-helix protein